MHEDVLLTDQVSVSKDDFFSPLIFQMPDSFRQWQIFLRIRTTFPFLDGLWGFFKVFTSQCKNINLASYLGH
jgi:hypothetical protein